MSRESLISEVFSSLDSVLLTRVTRHLYELQTTAPAWLISFQPAFQHPGDRAVISDISPFLDFFLEDAEALWQDTGSGKSQSDEWVEVLGDSTELPMSARAQTLNGESVLMLSAVAESYREKQRVHQHAREALLVNETLERELKRLRS